mgnify:CR=1 FL=1
MRNSGIHKAIALVCLLPITWLLVGCETTGITTLEERRASYQDAVDFLRLGETRTAEVWEKYGQPSETKNLEELTAEERPPSHIALATGKRWRYEQRDTVLMNAYTATSLGTDRSSMIGAGGFTHSLTRRTRMDLFFDAYGILSYYRIWRDAPGQQ